MNGITNTLNNIYSGFDEFGKRTDAFIDYLDQRAFAIKQMYDNVIVDVDEALNTINNMYDKLDSTVKKFKAIFQPWRKTTSTSTGYTGDASAGSGAAKTYTPPKPIIDVKPKVQKPVAQPVVKEISSNGTLDKLVKDFKEKISQHNKGYEVSVDVYDNGSVIKSYAPTSSVEEQESHEQTQIKSPTLDLQLTSQKNKSYLENLLERVDERFVDQSIGVTKLYNSGYNTRDIIKEINGNGSTKIKNFNDITDMVAIGIRAGLDYEKGKYNNAVASKLGARDQIIHDYISGKSYKEIKQNLKKNTSGMNISDSSILRIMHSYENKTGEKVVGKRNGKGKKKTGKKSGAKKGSKSGKSKGNGNGSNGMK